MGCGASKTIYDRQDASAYIVEKAPEPSTVSSKSSSNALSAVTEESMVQRTHRKVKEWKQSRAEMTRCENAKERLVSRSAIAVETVEEGGKRSSVVVEEEIEHLYAWGATSRHTLPERAIPTSDSSRVFPFAAKGSASLKLPRLGSLLSKEKLDKSGSDGASETGSQALCIEWKPSAWVLPVDERSEGSQGPFSRHYIPAAHHSETFSEQAFDRYAAVTAACSVGVWEWDITADRLQWNTAMYDLFEVDSATFLHTYGGFRCLVFEEDRAFVDEIASGAIKSRKSVVFRFRVPTKRKGVKVLEVQINTIEEHDHMATRLAGITLDVTERAAREKQRMKKEKREEIMKERARLSQLHRKKNLAFIRHLCHELRNPMTGIDGSISLVSDEIRSLKKKLTKVVAEVKQARQGLENSPIELSMTEEGSDVIGDEFKLLSPPRHCGSFELSSSTRSPIRLSDPPADRTARESFGTERRKKNDLGDLSQAQRRNQNPRVGPWLPRSSSEVTAERREPRRRVSSLHESRTARQQMVTAAATPSFLPSLFSRIGQSRHSEGSRQISSKEREMLKNTMAIRISAPSTQTSPAKSREAVNGSGRRTLLEDAYVRLESAVLRLDAILGDLHDASTAASYQTKILDDTLTLSRLATGLFESSCERVNLSKVLRQSLSTVANCAKEKGLLVAFDGVKCCPPLIDGESEADDGSFVDGVLKCGKNGPPASLDLNDYLSSLWKLDEGASEEERDDTGAMVETDPRHFEHILTTLLAEAIRRTSRGKVKLSAHLLPIAKEHTKDDAVETSGKHKADEASLNRFKCTLSVRIESSHGRFERDMLRSSFLGIEERRRNSLDNYRKSDLELAIVRQLAERLNCTIDVQTKGIDGYLIAFSLQTFALFWSDETRKQRLSCSKRTSESKASAANKPSPLLETRKGLTEVILMRDEAEQTEDTTEEEETPEIRNSNAMIQTSMSLLQMSSAVNGPSLYDEGCIEIGASASSWQAFPPGTVPSFRQPAKSNEVNGFEAPFVPHVLIVEDNALNQKILQKYLKKLGVVFSCAWDGAQAVQYFANSERGDPSSPESVSRSSSCSFPKERLSPSSAVFGPSIDFVFMDIRMPRMDGVEATREIRREEDEFWRRKGVAEGQRLPIVALSANTTEDDKREALEAGVDLYLTKPYRLDDIRDAMERFLPFWKRERPSSS